MANIIDYIDWRGDLSFEASPFNELDGLIFSEFCFLDLSNIVPREYSSEGVSVAWAVRRFFELHPESERLGYIIPEDIKKMAQRMATSKRFSALSLSGFVDRTSSEGQHQFCALSITLPNGAVMIAFRGTDDSLVGWHEDFNMMFTFPIPSQSMALEYTASIALQCQHGIMLGGHSKGGNLALYAGACLEPCLQERIVKIYNYDGPGFGNEMVTSKGYAAIRDKVIGIIPQASIIGMLFEHDGHYRIVKSRASGILQHNGFFWEVMGGSFVMLEELSRDSIIVNKAVRGLISQMDDDEKRRLVDTTFGIFANTNTQTLTELSRNKSALIKTVLKMPAESRDLFLKTIWKIVTESTHAWKSTPRKTIKTKGSSIADEKPTDTSIRKKSAGGQKLQKK